MNSLQSHDLSPDDPNYIEVWANDIVEAVGKRQAGRLLGEYQDIAANRRLPKSDRSIAEGRAKALSALL